MPGLQRALTAAQRWERRYGASGKWAEAHNDRSDELGRATFHLIHAEDATKCALDAVSGNTDAAEAIRKAVERAADAGRYYGRYEGYGSPASRAAAGKRTSVISRGNVVKALKDHSTYTAAAEKLGISTTYLKTLREKYWLS